MGLQQLARLEPLGLEMIAGALYNRHEVVILDMRLEPEALSTTLGDLHPKVVGISSTFTVDIYQALGVAEAIKMFDPGIFVVIGGHYPSLCPEDFYHPAVDAIVVGEGEHTMQELVDCLAAGDDPDRVPGLVLNRPERQYFTGPQTLIKNLDVLPYPRHSLVESYRKHYHLVLNRPVALLETTRGCPHRCRFCSVWKFYQERVRFKSPQRVIEELKNIEEPHVFFTDDSFLSSVSRVGKIARLIQERGIRKSYTIQARSDAIVRHPEIIAQWREVGLNCVFIGFEKPDQTSLNGMDKKSSVENNEAALKVLRQEGIEPVASFIADPDYGHDDFLNLRAYVRRLKLRFPAFTVLTPLPGTALFEEVKEQLTTANFELFDLLHAVLPTKLPLTKFYKEMASLWREAYPSWRLNLIRIYLFLRDLWLRSPAPQHWQRVLAEGKCLADAQTYLSC
jgi:radical SAM superfamily enzyme YgiQ (UPF0313 family)